MHRHASIFSSLLFAALTVACSKPLPKDGGLSDAERSYVEGLVQNRGEVVSLVVNAQSLPVSATRYLNASPSNGSAGLFELEVPSERFFEIESEILRNDPSAHVALNFEVAFDAARSLDANEQLLFSGKEEFGLTEWQKKFPKADGRNVKISVVDDGIALARPGLIKTSTGAAKFAGQVNVSPLWQVPIFEKETSCPDQPVAAGEYRSWEFEEGVTKLARATKTQAIDISPCGVNPLYERKPRECADWMDQLAGRESFAAVYAEFSARGGAAKSKLYVDFNNDKKISEAEVLEPLSDNGLSYYRFENGTALGFDLHDRDSIIPPGRTRDNPLRSCEVSPEYSKVISIAPPQSDDDFGGHGEGVASIAAGHNIGGRGFDGVAPSAQIFDVHFGDRYGGRRYTIAEVARSLRVGGLHADIVNLSYSLFFTTPVAQVAMGRVLESTLRSTDALYFFSAGNNGPGRGSMNRALLYPSFSIPVAAYLNPEMSQTVFGSAIPIGGVVTYSSRGPAVDGGAGALALSPLAGIAAEPASSGFGPFSGTSSATPALAGFAARVLSQVKAANLKVSRDVLRAAILQSAVALEDEPFVDQGYGIPKLVRAYELYESLIASQRMLPQLDVSAGKTGQGITRRGIYVRGLSERLDQYTVNVKPSFGDGWNEQDRADYTEHVVFKASRDWIKVPPRMLMPRGGVTFFAAIDWAKLDATEGNEFLGEIEIRSAETNQIRGVIPVTILRTDFASSEGVVEVDVPSGKLVRLFFEKPEWARYFVTSMASLRSEQALCGRVTMYSPAGINLYPLHEAGGAGSLVRDRAFDTVATGLYEVVIEGRSNHQACPSAQRVRVTFAWQHVEVKAVSGSRAEDDDGQMNVNEELQVSTEAERVSGRLIFSRPAHETVLEFPRAESNWERVASEHLDLTPYAQVSFKFGPEFYQYLRTFLGYPRWDLELYSTKSQKMPSVVGFDGAEWSEPVKVEEDMKDVEFVLSSFDIGISDLPGLRQINVRMRGESATASGVFGEVVNVQARRQTPAIFNLAIKGNSTDLAAGNTLLCHFQPSGFGVRIPCDTVDIP